MKKILFTSLFLFCLLHCDAQFITNIIYGNVGDYSLVPQTQVNVVATLLSPNPRYINNTLVRVDSVQQTTDGSGNFWFTNLQWGSYTLNIYGSSGTYFKFNVLTNTIGSNAITGLITNATPTNSLTNYLSQAQMSLLLSSNIGGALAGTNIAIQTNLVTNNGFVYSYYSINSSGGGGSSVNPATNIVTATNAGVTYISVSPQVLTNNNAAAAVLANNLTVISNVTANNVVASNNLNIGGQLNITSNTFAYGNLNLASNLSVGGLTVTNAVTLSGSFTGNGAGLTNVGVATNEILLAINGNDSIGQRGTGQPFLTPLAAIQAAQPGDFISVSPGLYMTETNLAKNNVTWVFAGPSCIFSNFADNAIIGSSNAMFTDIYGATNITIIGKPTLIYHTGTDEWNVHDHGDDVAATNAPNMMLFTNTNTTVNMDIDSMTYITFSQEAAFVPIMVLVYNAKTFKMTVNDVLEPFVGTNYSFDYPNGDNVTGIPNAIAFLAENVTEWQLDFGHIYPFDVYSFNWIEPAVGTFTNNYYLHGKECNTLMYGDAHDNTYRLWANIDWLNVLTSPTGQGATFFGGFNYLNCQKISSSLPGACVSVEYGATLWLTSSKIESSSQWIQTTASTNLFGESNDLFCTVQQFSDSGGVNNGIQLLGGSNTFYGGNAVVANGIGVTIAGQSKNTFYNFTVDTSSGSGTNKWPMVIVTNGTTLNNVTLTAPAGTFDIDSTVAASVGVLAVTTNTSFAPLILPIGSNYSANFTGNGAGLTNLNAAKITNGTVITNNFSAFTIWTNGGGEVMSNTLNFPVDNTGISFTSGSSVKVQSSVLQATGASGVQLNGSGNGVSVNDFFSAVAASALSGITNAGAFSNSSYAVIQGITNLGLYYGTGTNTFTNTVIATNAQSTSQFAGTFTGNASGITNDVKVTGTNMMGVPTNIFAGGWTNVSGTTGSTNFATGTYTNVFSSNGTISFIGAANTNTMGANGFTNATATITNVYGTATGTYSNISATASNTYGPNGQSNVFAGSTRFSVSVNGPQTLAENITSTSAAMVSGDFAAASGSATLKDSGISLTSAVFSNATVTANFTNNALMLYSNVQVTANSATTIYWTNLPARQCVAIPLIVMTNSATSPALALISESNASTGVIVTNPPIYAETFATIALSTNGANIDMGSNDTLIFTLTGCQTNIQIGLKYH